MFYPRRIIFVSFLLINVICISAQVQPRVPGNFSLQVNGIVRYAANRKPAENVLVRIESFSGGLISQVTTDRGGKFSFSGLAAMQYVVTVHAPGFQDARENVNLLTANTAYLNIDLFETRDKSVTAASGIRVVNANIPIDAQTEFAKGKSQLASKTADGTRNAVRSFENAIKIYPPYLEAQIMLGLANMDLQEWSKAEAALKKAIEIDPNASTAYFALAEALLSDKKFEQAGEAAAAGVRIDPSAAQGHLVLSKIYWQQAPNAANEKEFRKKAEDAWKEVSAAIKLDPNLAEAHAVAGDLLLRARRGKEALEHFETYLKLEPQGRFAEEVRAVAAKLRESIPPK